MARKARGTRRGSHAGDGLGLERKFGKIEPKAPSVRIHPPPRSYDRRRSS